MYERRHSRRDSFAFYDRSGRAPKKGLGDTRGTYMLMHIHTLVHNTATLNFLTNHRADGSAGLCLASYKQKRQRAVFFFASHSSSVSLSRAHTHKHIASLNCRRYKKTAAFNLSLKTKQTAKDAHKHMHRRCRNNVQAQSILHAAAFMFGNDSPLMWWWSV